MASEDQSFVSAEPDPCCLQVELSSLVLLSDPPRRFTFDGVLGPDCSQQEVFSSCALDLCRKAVAGYNASLYVYGQTGSGKTYTMLGWDNKQPQQGSQQYGLSHYAIDSVFDQLQGQTFSVKASCLEIYNEVMTDLLVEEVRGKGGVPLVLREHSTMGVFVEGLTDHPVDSPSSAHALLAKALRGRHVGSSYFNYRSSRSHCVFTLTIETTKPEGTVVSKLNMVRGQGC